MAALTQSHLGSTYPLPCWLKLCSAMLAQPICKHLPPPFSLLSCPHAQSLRPRHDFDFPPSLQQFKQGAGFTHTPVRSGNISVAILVQGELPFSNVGLVSIFGFLFGFLFKFPFWFPPCGILCWLPCFVAVLFSIVRSLFGFLF